jgi:hypothetical protein
MKAMGIRRWSDGNPSQLVRLLWFFLFLFSPASAVAYVSAFDLEHGNREALIHALAIVAVSLLVSLVLPFLMPVQSFDEAALTRAARGNLCLALFDTVLFALLMLDPSGLGQAAQTFPVMWSALAGMHYCYAVWAYTLVLIYR